MSESTNSNNISTLFQGASLAISFLTRIPLPLTKEQFENQKVWSWSFVFYPFCGYIIALFCSLPIIIITKYFAVGNRLPLFIMSTVFILIISEWLTRFLHFDGFCDVCDGFAAMTIEKSKRLDIMKDPHVGSSAVGAAIVLLIAKSLGFYLLFIECYTRDMTPYFIVLLFAIFGTSRMGMVLLAAVGKYPRETGTAKRMIGNIPNITLFAAFLTILPLFLILGRNHIFGALIGMTLPIFYWALISKQKFGGVTGDVLGAYCETTELVLIIMFLIGLAI